MSTRSQIKVIKNDKEVMLYHHCDGYPEGVGFCLLKILEMVKNKKYLGASSVVNSMITKGNFEITFGNHLDIEYYYELNFDEEKVICREVNNWEGEMEVLKEIELKYDPEEDVNVDEGIFE